MMDTKRFNDEHAAKSRAVCERIEREDAERRGKLADLVDAQLKGELGRAKAEADGWRKIAERRLGHIGECEKALAKRNALIVELEMRVKELEGELANAKVLSERKRKILDMWPRFEDGEYVWFGDDVSEIDARSFVFLESGAMVTNLTSVPAYGKFLRCSEPLKRPAPKDSWERLEEDACKGVCEYAGAYRKSGTIDSHECDGCRFDSDGNGPTCEKQMALDIIRRAKALAGVEVGE